VVTQFTGSRKLGQLDPRAVISARLLNVCCRRADATAPSELFYPNDSITRSIAGCVRFFILIQCSESDLTARSYNVRLADPATGERIVPAIIDLIVILVYFKLKYLIWTA
jgi:hypothetical protein